MAFLSSYCQVVKLSVTYDFSQYIMEGLAAAFMFVLGGSGFIVLDQTHATNMPKLNRMMLQFIGFGSLILAFSCCWIFMKIKLPGYMQS